MLTREILQRVREIQIRTGRQVADVLAGEYQSVFKGRGVEFDEVRPYTPGDDVRTIDWNVTARMGQPFVKRYVEERQLTLMLLTDISASQDFGSTGRSKREATAELSALLAFSAIRNDDKVGLILFHGAIEQYIPPRKGQKHVLRVIREVLTHGSDHPGASATPTRAMPWWRHWGSGWRRPRSTRQATHIAGALECLIRVTKRKSVCFVVSDFLDTGYERAMRMANRKHDVIAVHVTDQREQVLPRMGLVTLADAETGRRRLYDTGSKAFHKQFQALNQQRCQRLSESFRSAGIDYICIDAAGSVSEPLVKFFRQRERRRRR